MIRKYSTYLGWFCFSLLTSLVNAQSMSPDMRDLCDRASRMAFIPLPESIESPQPDPLFNAIEMGAGYKVVQSLIADRHPDEIVIQGMTPLAAAAYVGNWPAAQALIDRGADVNLEKPDVLFSPLVASILRSKYSVACKFIQNQAKFPISKADRDHFFFNSIVAAPDLHSDAATFIEYLLTNGFDPNDYGNKMETPLMGAVSLSNIPLIKVLLKHGARLDAVVKGDRTVWTVARKKNNPQVIQLLEEAQKKAAAGKTKAPKELVVQ